MKTLKIFSLLFLTFFLANCDKDDGPVTGCTDSLSDNFNSEAEEDDGSCSYLYGGREKGQIDVGSEVDLNNIFDIYIDGEFIGKVDVFFPNGAFCGAPENPGRIYDSGTHFVRAIGNGGVVREGNVNLSPQQCDVILVENLQIVDQGGGSGGGSGGGGSGGGGSGGGSGGGGSGGGGSNDPGRIKFWTAQDFGCGNISISVSGVGSTTITGFFDTGVSSCDTTGGGGNLNNIPAGNYSFSGSCSNRTWNGTVSVSEGGCTLFQLL